MVEDILLGVDNNVREQTCDTIRQDQERSLDTWIDYLSSGDATYPMWFKYYVFRNITKLARKCWWRTRPPWPQLSRA